MCSAVNGLCCSVSISPPSAHMGVSCVCSHKNYTHTLQSMVGQAIIWGRQKHIWMWIPHKELKYCFICWFKFICSLGENINETVSSHYTFVCFSHLEVVYLLIGALLLWCVFQGTPSHKRWGDLWTGGQKFNRLPQKSPLTPQFDSQSQSQQLLTLPLLSFSLVGNQLSSQTSSVVFSLHARLVGLPQTLHLLWGKMRRGDVGAVQQTLPATAQRRGSS